MIYFLYGEDTYRSRRKLNEIINEYRLRAGNDINVHRFDAQDQDIAELKRAFGLPSLFGGKKLVVIERAFFLPDDVIKLLVSARSSKDNIVVLWDEGGSDKKQIQKISDIADKTQTFEPLRGAQKLQWILAEASQRGLRLTEREKAEFASHADLWGIANELDVWALSRDPFSARSAAGGETVFRLGDTFLHSPKEALGIMFSLFESQDDGSVFAYSASHIRTLAIVKAFADRGQEVPSSFGMHPFVVKKAGPIVRFSAFSRLTNTMKKFFEEDFYCKIGLSRPRESLVRILLGAHQETRS